MIGDPVEHSLSPRIFRRVFQDLGIDAHYTALRVEKHELAEAIDRVRRGSLAGLSVTIPHKEAAAELVDALHPSAARIGAVNCIARSPTGHAEGYNTDAPGFRLAVEQSGARLAAARAVLLGAGGAARAAAFAAVSAGAKSLTIANRDPERAIRLGLELVALGRAWPEGELLRRWESGERAPRLNVSRALGAPSGKCFVSAIPLESSALVHPLSHADLLVNSTSVGLGDPGALPLPGGCVLDRRLTVMDMVYRPLHTALLRRAREAEATCVDGLWMLIHQALEQLRVWTGQVAPPALAASLHDELAAECG
ncbi:shikimate dehydrogenase family protein [Vulgatibacter incomptus]|uniref:Shikimate dehydrogenase (NADP(+)) n=1 Tax=Vulgatibacter incomptus TaxID=1391653 RepID=A0A0K1PHA9_9BACT|nr:shikimate dehydrogenase [Vulgatibacter incomptus]AKU92781.1 Shikimate 5-dehydrogenase I alpha [Vulgatibacter incomptus]